MIHSNKPLSVEELQNLSDDDAAILDECVLTNSDTGTDDEEWVARANRDMSAFLESSADAMNLLLGRK